MTLETSSPEFRQVIDKVVQIASMQPKKKWISVKEVGELYSIERLQCYELIKENLIISKKVGKKVLVSVASMDRYMEKE